MEINGVDIALLRREIEAGYTPSSATVLDLISTSEQQRGLLRECRAALDSLIAQKPAMAGLLCGSTTLGNLRAELHAYRAETNMENDHV